MNPASLIRNLTRAPAAAKVPEITVVFWVTKVLTTGMGEACSDFLASVNLVLAAAVGLLGFVGALWLQLRTRRYRAPVYWLAVAMVAVFGTMAADAVHLVGLPYWFSTAGCALAVAALFVLWRKTEDTVSIHSITTRRRELFYWATVFATFALGTAAGDLTALSMHLGFLASAVLFGVAIAVPAVAWWGFRINSTVAFWAAYVITRPLGASLADWFGKPPTRGGGLGYGDGTVTAVTTAALLVLVGYLTLRRPGVQAPDGGPAAQQRRLASL